MWSFYWLLPLRRVFPRVILVLACISTLLLLITAFLSPVTFRCMNRPHLICPSISRCAFVFLPLFGCYEQCFWKHSYTTLGVDACVELLSLRATICLTFWGSAELFSNIAVPFPQQCMTVPGFPHLCHYLLLLVFIYQGHCGSLQCEYEGVSHCGFELHVPNS